MSIEEYRPIKDYPNYEVSSLGNIRNIVTGKQMSPSVREGYVKCALTNEDARKTHFVHRLVAIAFIPNLENKSDVNHKDKNKINNCVENLEWMTRKENSIHRSLNTIIKCPARNKPINRCDKITETILETYNSIEDAALWTFNAGLTKTVHNGRNAIGNVVTGRASISYGYKWMLVKEISELENEEWKKVPNTIKTYYVSSLGRFKRDNGDIITCKPNISGYISVSIDNKNIRMHRLVAMTFLDNLENKEQVNHKDGNKTNNRIDNLEWVTNRENQIHCVQSGLRKNQFTRKIVQYDLNMNPINEFKSIALASKTLGLSKGNISGVLRERHYTAGGFIFKYLEE